MAEDAPIRVTQPDSKLNLTPYTMLFDPAANGVIKEKQKIDYDLTKPDSLRLGPYLLTKGEVRMHMSREVVEFVDIEFGLEPKLKKQMLYIISFAWPQSYLETGTLELINDKSDVIWRSEVTKKDLSEWERLLEQSKKAVTKKDIENAQNDLIEDLAEERTKDKKRSVLMRPENLNSMHMNSNYGHSRQRFYDIPIDRIKEPFRYCISQKGSEGRISLCSKRYRFTRQYGRVTLAPVRGRVPTKVLINDKPVAQQGTAVFLDFATPIKFSALIGDGTYFEFVSKPQPVDIIDIAFNETTKNVRVIGHGHQPVGNIQKEIYSDNIFLGFLNFMPTIGEYRNYWSAAMDRQMPSLYIQGDSGVPFRQPFTFIDLPKESYRPSINKDSRKNTYNRKVTLYGKAPTHLKLSTPEEEPEAEVERLDGENFKWTYINKQWGPNSGFLVLDDGQDKWKSMYQMYRGFPGEVSVRSTAVVSDSLDLVVLGEVAAQYWFDDILWLDSYYLTQQRWGVSAKYFKTLLVGRDDPVEQGIVDVEVTEANLKYRFDPGIWARDPSVGMMLSYQNLSYTFREDSTDLISENAMLGIGAFWARSMPEVFDKVFNIIPWFRYPKWVDMEVIYYPVSLESQISQGSSMAFNFHGKVHWTDRIYGEGGFGLKVFSYADPDVGEFGKSIGFAMAYGTVGIGMNF